MSDVKLLTYIHMRVVGLLQRLLEQRVLQVNRVSQAFLALMVIQVRINIY